MSSATPSGIDRATRNEASFASHDAAGASSLSVAEATGVAVDCRVETAGPGDHPLVYQLLRSVFHGPSDSEFHAQLDHPLYEPSHRLLVRRRGLPVAHVRTCPREMNWGSLRLTAAYLADLATLPEFSGRGYATALLSAVEESARRASAELMVLRTGRPEFYARRGWVICGRHAYSSASPRNLLAVLHSTARGRRLPSFDPLGESAHPVLNVRLWRHIEQDDLQRLYRAATDGAYGAPVRNDAYWHWLLCRRGYDRIYVAVESAASSSGASASSTASAAETIVGYAVMQRGRIVELIAEQQRGDVKAALLARACSDAIERDEHLVRYDAPPGDCLHPVFEQADGMCRWREIDDDEVFMINVFTPVRLLRRMADLLHERACAADLPRPFELGIDVGGRRLCLVGTRRSVRIRRGRLGRSYLVTDPQFFTQMLLGHHAATGVSAGERCKASTRVAVQIATALFPRLPLWYPPLDDLPA